MGGITATVLAGILYILQMKQNETANVSLMGRAFLSGLKAMMPAVLILSWHGGLQYLIDKLETGLYLI